MRNVNVLEYFLDTPLKYRKADKKHNTISNVDRLPPDLSKGLPLRFSKKIEASNQFAYLIEYESRFLGQIPIHAPNAKIVKHRAYSTATIFEGKSVFEVVTDSAGVDIKGWHSLPVRYNGYQYANIFSHPSALLRFVHGSLVALKSIHQYGIVHCDIKEDQLCIPFKINLSKSKKIYHIEPNFANITIIDFGVSLWNMCQPVNNMINPIPLKVSKNWMRGDYSDLEEQSYRGRGFAEAAVNQVKFHKKYQHYSFAEALQDTDCGMDLYSFGYLLMCLISEDIKRLDVDDKAWGVFWGGFEKWIKDELMDHEYGLVHPYSRNNLPHDTYIKQIETWISQVDHVLGYSSEHLVFEVDNKKLMMEIRDKESPLVSEIRISKKNKYSIKKILTGIILIPLILFILLIIMVDDSATTTSSLPTPIHDHYIITTATIQDTKSGLTWRYCPVGRFGTTGECVGETSLLNYSEMLKAIDKLNTQNNSLGIQGKWRLPTLKEIETIKLCNKSMTTLTIANKPTNISYTCKVSTNAKSSGFFDDIAFPYLANTSIWSSNRVSKTDMTLFDNQEEGYWTVNLSSGSIAKTTPKEKKAALLILDTSK